MLLYAPLAEPAPYPGEPAHGEGGDRREHWVNGFVRKLPPGAQASERQLSLHERAIESEEVPAAPLDPGFTFVKRHHRTG